jgi:hypothetical protein
MGFMVWLSIFIFFTCSRKGAHFNSQLLKVGTNLVVNVMYTATTKTKRQERDLSLLHPNLI